MFDLGATPASCATCPRRDLSAPTCYQRARRKRTSSIRSCACRLGGRDADEHPSLPTAPGRPYYRAGSLLLPLPTHAQRGGRRYRRRGQGRGRTARSGGVVVAATDPVATDVPSAASLVSTGGGCASFRRRRVGRACSIRAHRLSARRSPGTGRGQPADPGASLPAACWWANATIEARWAIGRRLPMPGWKTTSDPLHGARHATALFGRAEDPDFERHLREGPCRSGRHGAGRYKCDPRVIYVPGWPVLSRIGTRWSRRWLWAAPRAGAEAVSVGSLAAHPLKGTSGKPEQRRALARVAGAATLALAMPLALRRLAGCRRHGRVTAITAPGIRRTNARRRIAGMNRKRAADPRSPFSPGWGRI